MEEDEDDGPSTADGMILDMPEEAAGAEEKGAGIEGEHARRRSRIDAAGGIVAAGTGS